VGAQRLTALADGVFAIAMTLLVLELAVPVVTEEGADLGELLLEMWPEFLMYALGFLVLGVYWIIHHMIFESIERYDTTLAWLNIIYLMFAALIPFVTALVVQHGATTATALAFGLDLLALFAMGWAMWTYATTGGRLSGDRVAPDVARGASTMGLVYFVALLVSLVLAVLVPLASMVVYAAIVIAFIGFTVAGRWETVTLWRRSLRRS
jgi:uncharacterized membrane protein